MNGIGKGKMEPNTTFDASNHVTFCHNSRCLHCNSDPQLRDEIEAAWKKYEERAIERAKRPHDHTDFFGGENDGTINSLG